MEMIGFVNVVIPIIDILTHMKIWEMSAVSIVTVTNLLRKIYDSYTRT